MKPWETTEQWEAACAFVPGPTYEEAKTQVAAMNEKRGISDIMHTVSSPQRRPGDAATPRARLDERTVRHDPD